MFLYNLFVLLKLNSTSQFCSVVTCEAVYTYRDWAKHCTPSTRHLDGYNLLWTGRNMGGRVKKEQKSLPKPMKP